MKKIVLGLAATASLLSLAGPASAAPWQSVNQRQASLDQRIDRGVRNGALTRNEAQRLRARFAQIQRLERQYRRGGLTVRERRDLDQRLTDLQRNIRVEKRDRQYRG
jgi:TolA-binding protein